MASNQVDISDCKVRVRKYVLVSRPSRWKQKGERVVVQSPMLNIPKTVLHVPVKRYTGEEQNSVCFIPKQDIEEDISSIYENAEVTTTESWVDAHGVALFDSTLDNSVTYRRGDRFWICIGTATNFKNVVPVINLNSQTFEKGNIPIDQVCWFPKIQGPNGELWTLGGETRQLKLSGRKNYSYLSWAVCQLLDGSSPTTEIVPMPANDVELETRRQLSISESRSLFVKRLRCMEVSFADGAIRADKIETRSQFPADHIPRDRISLFLPTPPASPDQEPLPLQQLLKMNTFPAQKQRPPIARPWRGIFELSGQTNGKYVLRNSLIHPPGPPQSCVERWLPSVSSMTINSENEDCEMNDDSSTCYNARESSPAHAYLRDEDLSNCDLPDLETSDLYSSDLPGLDGPGVWGAQVLFDLCRKEKETLVTRKNDHESDFYDDDTNNYLDTESFREAWMANKPAKNPRITALCSNEDPQCPYTILSTRLHYHCPAEKCRLSKPTSPANSSSSIAGKCSPDDYDPNHVHCVSRLGPFPDSAGECHLYNSLHNFKTHKCCYWKDEYVDEMTSRGKRAYEKRKEEEARRKHMQIRDRSSEISIWLEVGKMVGIRDCERLEGLEEGGRGLLGELESGVWDGDVAKMGEVIGGMRDELEAMDGGFADDFGF
ncbi:hypothetical protein N431DRAFT_340250 [Stipitochalara longipes BDJ]|nr:hypothetical protein N431DRAFT_340250 [Stipitochalara longipes BDJ]